MIIDVWSFSESFTKEIKESKYIDMEDREPTFIEECLNKYSIFSVFDFGINYTDLLKYDAIISISDIYTDTDRHYMPLSEDSVSTNGIIPAVDWLGIPFLSVSIKKFKPSLACSLETDNYKVMNATITGFNLLKQHLNQFNPKKVLIIYSPTDGYYSPKHIDTYNRIVKILNENNSNIT